MHKLRLCFSRQAPLHERFLLRKVEKAPTLEHMILRYQYMATAISATLRVARIGRPYRQTCSCRWLNGHQLPSKAPLCAASSSLHEIGIRLRCASANICHCLRLVSPGAGRATTGACPVVVSVVDITNATFRRSVLQYSRKEKWAEAHIQYYV